MVGVDEQVTVMVGKLGGWMGDSEEEGAPLVTVLFLSGDTFSGLVMVARDTKAWIESCAAAEGVVCVEVLGVVTVTPGVWFCLFCC